MTLTMVDWCSGLGGASEAMKRRGWRVIRIDNNPAMPVDVVGDILAPPIAPFPIDLMWFSPPCLEYSRYDQPWFKPKVVPDLTIYRNACDLITLWQPRFWVIENVRGAVRWWGAGWRRYGSHYVWSNLPLLPTCQPERTHTWGSNDPQERARIPYELSEGLAELIEAAR